MDEDVFRNLKEIFGHPDVQGCLSAVESIVGFKLAEVDRQPFLYFHNFISNPQPAFITAWRANPKLEQWYHRFVNGFLGDVQNALACVLYHHGRLKAIENSVIEIVEKLDCAGVLQNSTIALGNTLVWDFEFQAFVLAYRRCLDYLTRAICTYFRQEFHSFRRLDSFLGKAKPNSVARPLIPIHEKYSLLFQFALSEGNRKKSLRDTISHYTYLPVGVINLVGKRGLMLAGGGGEQLGVSQLPGGEKLSDVLDRHVDNLRGCIREMVYQLVDSIRAEQAANI